MSTGPCPLPAWGHRRLDSCSSLHAHSSPPHPDFKFSPVLLDIPVVPTRGGTTRFCHTGDIWQGLEAGLVVRSGWAESGRLENTLKCAGWPHHGITGPCNKAARPGAQRLRLMPRTVALETLPISSALASSAVCFSPLEHQLHQNHPELTASHSHRAFARAVTTLARSSSHHRSPCSLSCHC